MNRDEPAALDVAVDEFFDAYDRTHLVHDVAYENVNDAVAALRLAAEAVAAVERSAVPAALDVDLHIHDYGDAEYADIKAGRADCADIDCPGRPAVPAALDRETAIRDLWHLFDDDSVATDEAVGDILDRYRPAVPAALDVRDDWTARRAALRGRWSGNGLSPMTASEMAGAVARDANEGECETCVHHDMDHYDRRGLLNLVSSLLDRIAARPAAPVARRHSTQCFAIGPGPGHDRCVCFCHGTEDANGTA